MKHDTLLVGTYHKTGTVWLQRVFIDVAEKLAVPFAEGHNAQNEDQQFTGIFMDGHCRFSDSLLEGEHVGFRMIRDPRDVVISGAHYHMKSEETWLHDPLPALGGQTYQQAILAEPDTAARYIFEARQVANATTRDMVRDCERLGEFVTVRYESWMADETMSGFTNVMGKMGLTADECDVAKQAFYRWSLFGRGNKVDDHARSGKVAQWRTVFTRPIADAFLEVHGDALIALGYEPNHDWVLALPIS